MKSPLGYLVVRGGQVDDCTLYVDRSRAEVAARELEEITGEPVDVVAVDRVREEE